MAETSEQVANAAQETAVEQTAQTPAPQQATQTTESSAAMSPEERYQARRNAPKQVEQPKQETQEAEVSAETTEETQQETVNEGEEEVTASGDESASEGVEAPKGEEKILPNRITTKQFTPTEQEAIALLRQLRQDDPNATLKDAYVIVEQRQQEAAQQAKPSEQNEADPVKEFETKLTELREKRREFAKEGKLYETELDDVNIEIEDTIQKLAEAKAEQKVEQKRRQQEDTQKITTAFEKSKQTAIEVYPDLADTDSALGMEANAYIQELHQPGNPNASILQAPDAPMVVAQMAATRLAGRIASEKGIGFQEALNSLLAKPKAKAATPQVQKPKAPAQPARVTPASGATQQTPPPPKPKFNDWNNGAAIEQRIAQRRAEAKAARSGFGISFAQS